MARGPLFVGGLLIGSALLFLPISGSAAQEPPLTVKYQLDQDGWAVWRLYDRYIVSVTTACHVQKKWDFWPIAECGGAIRPVYTQSGTLEDMFSKPPIQIGTLDVTPDVYLRKIERVSRALTRYDARNQDSEKAWGFNELLESPTAIVKVMGNDFELAGFHQFAASDLKIKRKAIQGEINRDRMILAATTLASLLGIILGGALLLRIFRYLYLKVPGLIGGGIKSTRKGWTNWRIQSIALEETVRRTTRGGLDSATEQETAALRRQISDALDSGDTELATTLNAILRRLEGGKSD